MKRKMTLRAAILATLAIIPGSLFGQESPEPSGTSVGPASAAVSDESSAVAPASFFDPNCAGPSCTSLVSGEPSCTDGVGDDCGPRYRSWDLFGSVEYLMWWTKGSDLPPLIGTTPFTPRPQAALITTPGYQNLYGGGMYGTNLQNGGRATLGAWLDGSHNAGIALRFYALEGATDSYDGPFSDGVTGPIIGRPYYDVTLPGENAVLTSYPAVASGSAHAKYTNNFFGTDVYLRVMMERATRRRIDVLAGYQFFRLDDGLVVTSNHTITDPNSLAFGFQLFLRDRFRTFNEFHGGTVGIQTSLARGQFSTSTMLKVAAGLNRQTIRIQGDGLATAPFGGPSAPLAAGVLAWPSNSGTYTRDRICVVPEITTQLNYHFSREMSVSLGYNFMWMSNVVTTGKQIDRRVNPTQLPGPVVGLNAPAFLGFRESNYWIQGLNFGFNWNF